MSETERSEIRLFTTLEQLLRIDVTDRQAALRQMAQRLSETLSADKVDIMLLDDSTASLVALGTSDTPMGRREHALGMDRLPLANGGNEVKVFTTGTPYVTGHADQEPDELPGFVHGLGIRSSMVVPLEFDGTRRGVVLASASAEERFDERDLTFLESVARWVGLVLHRAELIEERLASAREVGRRLAADELITVVAHDLRNYLTPLKARVDLLHRRAERVGNTADLRDTEAVRREVERLNHLISNLLDASRIEQGMFLLDTQPVDILALVQEVAATFSLPPTPVHVRLPPEVGEVIVDGDIARIRQAIENLVANALRYAPPDTSVTLAITLRDTPTLEGAVSSGTTTTFAFSVPDSGTRDAGWVDVTVADRGPGIAPEVAERLFTRFSAEERSPGLGLGLYLASEIAQAHAGTLAVESQLDEGTRFHLLLPRAQEAPR